MEKSTSRKAIIIGAGPAGLTAAYELLKKTDITPIIFEESEYIGGISRTARYNGNRMDIGGHRFFSKAKEVTDLWEEIMPLQGKDAYDDKVLGRKKNLSPGGPDPEKEDRVMLIRQRVSRIFYLRKFFDYPISLKLETFTNMGFKRTMKSGFGYLESLIHKREEKSLADFYINRFGKPLYEMFFEDYTEKLWGVNPTEIAPDWGAQRVKGLSLSKAVFEILKKPFKLKNSRVETSLIEEFFYPKKGPGQLWEALAEQIEDLGGEIRYKSKVTKIRTLDGNISGVTVFENGEEKEYQGDFYISSMPIKDLITGMTGNVPQDIYDIAANLPYRDFITVGLLLKKLKIKNQTNILTLSDIVPDCWIYIQERDVKIGRLQIFNNWSPYMVKNPDTSIWVGLEYFCSEGDEMWNASDEDFINFAIDELVKIDIVESKDDVLDSTRLKVRKAYPAYFGTYKEFDKVKEYLNGYKNLYCVGRNGQHRYNNMDHSMMTAMEAVKAIMGIGSKESVWAVNTEEEYHEEKRKQ